MSEKITDEFRVTSLSRLILDLSEVCLSAVIQADADGKDIKSSLPPIAFQTTNKQSAAKFMDKKLHQYFSHGFV